MNNLATQNKGRKKGQKKEQKKAPFYFSLKKEKDRAGAWHVKNALIKQKG